MTFAGATHIYGSMKTTIEIPESLFYRAKVLAAQRKTTLKQLVVEGLERVTASPSPTVRAKLTREQKQFFVIDADGIPVLKKRAEGITNETVNRMRDELGI